MARWFRRSWFSVAIMLAVTSGTAKTIHPSVTPLPSVMLIRADGTWTNAQDVKAQGKWLLVYVRADSTSSLRLLDLLDGSANPKVRSSMIVVVGKLASVEMKTLASHFPHFDATVWYADPEGQLPAKLNFPGVPVVLAINGNKISWRLAGMPSTNPGLFEAILSGWH
jgi:hypothetical protein